MILFSLHGEGYTFWGVFYLHNQLEWILLGTDAEQM